MLFRGKYAFLSNFYHVWINYEGVMYPTVEHAYQAAKTLEPGARRKISSCRSPGEAKRLGRTVPLRAGWKDIRLGVMEILIRKKFENASLATRLGATGNIEIIEENNWNDTFWGICNGKGENHLGKIIMMIRDELTED